MDSIRFYGYKHWTLEDPPRCFNVGKGLRLRPFEAKGKRSHKWHHNVKRLGLCVEVCIGPVTNEEACTWEKANIKLMGTRSNSHTHNNDADIGCNFTDGGEGTSGCFVSEETRAKLRGRVKSPEECAKISHAKKGSKHTDNARAKIRAKRALQIMPKGRKHTEETKAILRNPSPETLAKMRAAKKGSKHTEETKAILRNPSPEIRAKLRAKALMQHTRNRIAKGCPRSGDEAFACFLIEI